MHADMHVCESVTNRGENVVECNLKVSLQSPAVRMTLKYKFDLG
jgi:hypothetical protein